MSALVLVLVMAGGMFGLRLSGFSLANVTIPARWERALGFVPIATLTALAVTSLAGRGHHLSHGVLAAMVGVASTYLTRRPWASIIGGMLAYWLLTAIT